MAYGSELYLGVLGIEAVKVKLKALNIKTVEEGIEGYLDFDYEDCPNFQKIQQDLVKAHRHALEEIGLKIIDPKDIVVSIDTGRPVDTDNYFYVLGLDGVIRRTNIWLLEIEYDPFEMGHTPIDMLLGVSLISRYNPVYLDWTKDSGGSGDDLVFSPDVMSNIEIARKHISKVLPFIEDVPMIFRQRHY